MKERKREFEILLTSEEAFGLLDMVLLSPTELSPEQRMAAVKLSDFCRQMLRETEDAPRPTLSVTGLTPTVFAA